MKWLTRMGVVVFAVFATLASTTSARADSFGFSYSGSGFTASGTLTTDPLSDGSYLITGLSGTQNGQTMTILDPGEFLSNDNLLYPSAPFLDFDGLSFVADGIDYNVFFNSNTSAGPVGYYIASEADIFGSAISFSVTPAPEPLSVLLLGFGLLGVLGLRKRATA
jgi:hypothetical protein